MTLWFVSPAWQRYEMTAICLEQRRRVIDELAAHGIEAQCVVVADDDNLDIAASLGFATVEQNNDWLGRRFNDGQEYAARHGAEWIVSIGSDSWIDPAYFLPLPRPGQTLTSNMYAPVTADRLAELNIGKIGGGPYVFHRSLLEPTGFRPAPDEISHRFDHHTIKGIGAIDWLWRNIHPLQNVGFRYPPFITSYEGLLKRWGVAERTNPWQLLAQHYPLDLVERARVAMSGALA